MNSSLLHPSGGLLYHLRAWRYRRGLWAPFHSQVRRWLTDWRPDCDDLLLIGPSGGYALSRPFLERFRQIRVIEPDPLARWILRRRFAGIDFAFAAPDLTAPEGPAKLVHRYPQAAFLFCNLFGQELVGAAPDFDRQTWLRNIEEALADRQWASWHELVSSALPPINYEPLKRDQAEALEEICAHFWPGGDLPLIDHSTAGLCSKLPRCYALWPLTPHQYHLVEWLKGSDPPKPAITFDINTLQV